MKFALINDNKVEATRGAKGVCPNCKAEVIAKCGDRKIHHWAHKGNRNCDPWWEPETEWHRLWKNNFSKDWQEFPFRDEVTNEKHIADVRTEHGLVLEFQHSHINPIERVSRETFFKRVVWVIDGTRLKRDYPRFSNAINNFRRTNMPGIFEIAFLEECFPQAWIGSSAPVVFDFKGNAALEDPKDLRHYLFCLLPKKNGRPAMVATLSRKNFIDWTTSGEWLTIGADSEKTKQNKPVQQSSSIHNPPWRREPPFVFHRGRHIKRRRF